MDEAVARCEAAIDSGQYLQHMSVNAAKLVAMEDDEELREAVRACELVTADGQSVVWAARLLGYRLPERVAGIDLMERMLAVADRCGYGVFFLGAREDVLERAIEVLRGRFPRLIVAGSQHGYFTDEETDAIAGGIRESGADILFVAMSSPRKEHFLGRVGPARGAPFAMGVGGSIDVIAGLTRRAPVLLQRAGLEWAYRVAQEPRRLARRYVVGNAAFAWMVLKARLSRRASGRGDGAGGGPGAAGSKAGPADRDG